MGFGSVRYGWVTVRAVKLYSVLRFETEESINRFGGLYYYHIWVYIITIYLNKGEVYLFI